MNLNYYFKWLKYKQNKQRTKKAHLRIGKKKPIKFWLAALMLKFGAKKMARVLITGISGFVGSHLSEYVLKNNLGEVHGIIRSKNTSYSNIKGILHEIKLHECDMTDYYSLAEKVAEIQPDLMFHLAAQAYVPSSWAAPIQTINNNMVVALNLFEAVRKSHLNPIIHIAGSSEEYGLVNENEIPITEENFLRPLSPYAVSKVAMDLLGWQYFKSYGMKIIRTRAFNHTGPRRGGVYATSNFAKQIAEIEILGNEPVISTGNLESIRDFTDVRDVVHAYWLATQKGDYGDVYNICSGKGIKMKEMLDLLLSFSDKKVTTRFDPNRARPSDVPVLIGSHKKFSEKTGWEPKIPFEKTMKDLLEYWRESIKKQKV